MNDRLKNVAVSTVFFLPLPFLCVSCHFGCAINICLVCLFFVRSHVNSKSSDKHSHISFHFDLFFLFCLPSLSLHCSCYRFSSLQFKKRFVYVKMLRQNHGQHKRKRNFDGGRKKKIRTENHFFHCQTKIALNGRQIIANVII